MIRRLPQRATSARILAAGLCIAASFHTPLYGQVSGPSSVAATDQAIVGSATGQNAKGAVSVNVASGSNNQQLRSLVIANGANALATGAASQTIAFQTPGDPSSYVGVGQGVFQGASGALSLNVAAGNANQEANLGLFAIGVSGIAMTDALLSQSRASGSPDPASPSQTPTNNAAVPTDAFGGAQGLVQINLTAGNRNSSANIFALTAAGGF